MAKEITGFVKLQIKGGQANPAPPVGPALGQRGINIMEFCKAFNEKTKSMMGKPVPVVITVYKDKKFDFIIKTPPASHYIKEAAKLKGGSKEVAIVFGREDRGLTNEELGMCNLHVHIPTDESYSSLNLSQAVQILSYEVRLAFLEEQGEVEVNAWDVELANSDQTERLINHMDELMQEVDFYDTQNPRKLLTRVRRFYKRSQIDVMEANIFRGFFSAIQKRLKK